MIKQFNLCRVVVLLVIASMVLTNAGCIGGLAQILYVIKGHKTPAAFKGLEGKKVAVVVVSDASAYGADTVTYNVGKMISLKLANNVKNIEVVPPTTIENWMDTNNWDQASFAEVGRGVGAQVVLSVEISSYTIHDGATLYKGQSDVAIAVHNLEKGGQVEFSRGPSEYVFPKTGRPAIQTSDRQFEAMYLNKLTDYVGRLFYASDQLDSVAEDAAMPF